jgi:hypothetical protein
MVKHNPYVKNITGKRWNTKLGIGRSKTIPPMINPMISKEQFLENISDPDHILMDIIVALMWTIVFGRLPFPFGFPIRRRAKGSSTPK